MQSATYSKTSTNANAYLDKLPFECRRWIDLDSPLDQPLSLTTFPTQGAQRKEEIKLSLRQLESKIGETGADDKASLPWLKGARFGDKRSPLRPHPTKPGKQTGNSLRHDANVLAVTAVELDYDAGGISPEEARDRLKRAGITALVYTTPSHTPAAPRWRVLAPCSEELPPARRADLVARLNGLLDGEIDGASFTLSQAFYQAFYYGGVKGGARVRVLPIEGRRYIDQAADLDATAISKRARTNDNSPPDGPFNEAGLIEDITTGANYHGSAIALLGHWAAAGASYIECRSRILEAFHAIPEDVRRPQWGERVASIPDMLAYVFGKQIAETYENRDRLMSLYPDLPDEETDDSTAEPVAGLTFSTPSECAVADARRYVIKGLVAEGDVACIVGAPGVGKSLLAPRLGYAVAQGQDIFGMRVRQGGVFYVAAEDEHGMRSRVTALKDRHGDADQFVLVGGVSDLLTKGSTHPKALRAAVQERRPSLVIIDTLAMAFPGLEENTAEAMGRVVAVARSLTRWGAAVILIHHDTKDGQQGLPRGHSLLNGALDVSIHLTKGEGDIVRSTITKNRNGSQNQDIAFKIGTRTLGRDEDGDDINAALAEECSAPVERQERMTPSAKAAYETFHDLRDGRASVPEHEWRKACVEGRTVSASDKAESRAKTFKRAAEELTRRGKITFRKGDYFPTVIDTPTEFDDIDDQAESTDGLL